MQISNSYTTQPLTAEELKLAKKAEAGGFGTFIEASRLSPSQLGITIMQAHEIGFVCRSLGRLYSMHNSSALDGFNIPKQHGGIDLFHDNHLLLGRGGQIALSEEWGGVGLK